MSQERAELEILKKRQNYLETQLAVLAKDIQRLENRLEAGQDSASLPASIEPNAKPWSSSSAVIPEAVITPLLPPPIPVAIEPSSPQVQAANEIAAPELAIIPPVIPATVHEPIAESPITAAGSEVFPAAKPIEEQETAPTKGSFEMRMGTYWFVRIGIVMLLTALGFFARFAYQKYIPHLGPAGKVAMLYCASGALLGIGAWLQRKKEKEALQNFGQVLIAGGLAAVYFTTYAAHYFAPVKIIDSPVLAGALLMGWAAFIVWLADWRKSEVLGLFAVALAYYTSVISPIELFTLYSNLLLTLVAVVFLVRNRWATVSFISLAATYFSFGFWRFYHTGHPIWQGTLLPHDFWTGNLFLLGYWILFTAAVFLSRHEMFSGWSRAVFLTANNAAFFAYVALSIPVTYPGSFWKFSLGYGVVLIGLALLARLRLENEKAALNAYVSQGLLLVTLGFMTYFTGPNLALVLAAESVALLVLGSAGNNLVMRSAAVIIAGLAVAIGLSEIQPFRTKGLFLGIGLGALMIFNARWTRRPLEEANSASRSATYYSALGLLTWLVATWRNTAPENLAPVLAAETLLITASIYALRLRELTLLAQVYLVLGQLLLVGNWFDKQTAPPWWNPASVIAVTLALSHWWQHQKTFFRGKQISQVLQGVYALAIVGVLFCWLNPIFAIAGSRPTWLWLTSALAIGITVYGVLTRAWLLIATGQLFLVISAVEFFRQMFGELPSWPVALAPIATLVLLALSARAWLKAKPETSESVSQPIQQISLVYRAAALLLTLLWVHKYIPENHRFWVLGLMGGLLFLVGGLKPNPERLVFSAVLTVAGFVYFWLPNQGEPAVSWLNLFAILFLLAQQQIARRLPASFSVTSEIHTAMILVGGCGAWLYVSRWVLLKYSGFYLTASWAGLAFVILAAGLLLQERVYRWLGLVVLAAAVGRVTLLDVWKLETLPRILSFFALGVVLVVLGFIYNKYQEKIKMWL